MEISFSLKNLLFRSLTKLVLDGQHLEARLSVSIKLQPNLLNWADLTMVMVLMLMLTTVLSSPTPLPLLLLFSCQGHQGDPGPHLSPGNVMRLRHLASTTCFKN